MSQENVDEFINYMMNSKNNKKKNAVITFLGPLLYSGMNYSEQPPMTLEEANQFREKLREERKIRMARDTNPNE